jgi:type III secretion system YscQ/HrcQ family protein
VRWGGRITLALFEPRRALDEARLVALALRVEAVGTSGLVKLDVPYEWLALGEVPASGAPSGAFSTVVGRLPIVASIEIASTDLPLRELDAAGVGDAVVFEGRAALPACDWPVELRIGDYSVGAIARDGGVIVLSGPLRSIRSRGRSPAPAGPVPRVIVRKADVMTPDPDDLNTEVLAAAPVEVVAELGRIVLRGDEVLALERGSVLSVAHQGGRIDLVVGGRPWARGELVNVDGDLGVRVTELVRR